MNQKKQHNALKTWIKRLLWVLVSLLVLGLALRLSLKTDFVQAQVKKFIVSTANSQLNAEFTIDELSGDLWKNVNISNIQLTQQQDTLAQIDSVQASYTIWKLLQGKIDVDTFGIYQPHITARQDTMGWNWARLMPPSTDPDTSTTTMMDFQIRNITVQNGAVSVSSDSLPVGSNYKLKNLDITSSVGYNHPDFEFNLRDLSFQLGEESMASELHLQASASGQDQQITLQQLVLATGTSALTASGFTNWADTTIALGIESEPLQWQDISAITERYPLREDLDMELSVKGNAEQLDFSVIMQANSLDQLEIKSQLTRLSDPILREFSVSANYIDAATLLGDSTLPQLHDASLSFDGDVPLSNIENATGNLQFSANDIHYPPYHFQQIAADGNIDHQQASLKLEGQQNQQHLDGQLNANQIWSPTPTLEGALSARNINLSYWMQDTTYQGNLSFDVQFNGQDWYPQEKPWNYTLNMTRGQLFDQQITAASIGGTFTSNSISADGELNIEDSFMQTSFSLQNINQEPRFSYQIAIQRFDLGMFLTDQDFSTSLNGEVVGEGTGIDLANMDLRSSVRVDSSIFNNETIEEFSADVGIRDSVVTVDSAQFASAISDGKFDVQLNILDLYDPDNKLSLDMQLKDLSALAPLADADTLSATGNIDGTLQPIENQNLRFLGTIDLEQVAYDSLFTSKQVRGSVDVTLGEKLMYSTNLDLTEPSFTGIPLQNVSINTQGSYADSVTAGQVDFQLSSTTDGRIEQSGQYHISPDSLQLNTSELNFISDYRMLALENPFEMQYQNEQLRIDTLRISSGDGAFLETGIPILSQNEQRGFIRARGLNMAVIQSSFLGETYIDGMLGGSFQINRQDTNLSADGNIVLSEFMVQGASFDSLNISGDIANERLNGAIALHHEQDELLSGDVQLPFKLGNPEEFDESFFNEPISGDLRVWDISINRFNNLFDQVAETETSGILSFWGTLGGTAGDPEFDADVSLKDAVLSGVGVDSVVAGANYRHVDEELSLNATVTSLKQTAAEISARFPLFIDMKTFRVDFPQQNDRIAADIETNDFNLRALNDFIDPLFLRDVRGQLNGDLTIKGPMNQLQTRGDMNLAGGRFQLVPLGITVTNIASDVGFEPNQITVSRLSAQNNNGNFRANGTIALNQLTPEEIDIKMKAQNFRIANTPDANAIINLDARTKGSITSPSVSGSVDVVRGFLKLDNFGEKSVEKVQLSSEEDQEFNTSVYDSLALDMDLGFNRRFFIQNEQYLDLEVELDGTLDLVKQGGDELELFGTMNTASGYARPFGKQFDLEEGSVTFSGNPENPQLMIRTKYEPPQTDEDIVIWYIIEGTVENPSFKYESQPPMELENIISYTLFGQPFYALDSWKQVVASSGSNTTAADVALDVLLDRVEALATQQLGIDVVKIDNTRSGGEAGTSITTGWYLNPKVFFAIQNVITGSTPETGFLLEYMLREDLKLILRQGNNIRQGVDLRWNYDY